MLGLAAGRMFEAMIPVDPRAASLAPFSSRAHLAPHLSHSPESITPSATRQLIAIGSLSRSD